MDGELDAVFCSSWGLASCVVLLLDFQVEMALTLLLRVNFISWHKLVICYFVVSNKVF
jgi:hypothetical protein